MRTDDEKPRGTGLGAPSSCQRTRPYAFLKAASIRGDREMRPSTAFFQGGRGPWAYRRAAVRRLDSVATSPMDVR